MLGSENYSEPRGCQMLQMQVPVAAMIVMQWRIGKTETVEFRNHVTAKVIQNRGFAKRFHSDSRKACKVMRWGENGDITLFEQRPVVDTLRRILEITNQSDIHLALQQQLDEAVLRFLAKLDTEARYEFANFRDRLENKRSGNGWGETDRQRSYLLPLKLTRAAPDGICRCKGALEHRQNRLPQIREVSELTLSVDELASEL